MTDNSAAKAKLTALRAEILDLSALSEGDRETVKLDQTSVGRLSRMDALQRQAMAEAADRRRMAELQRIDAALLRIADGDYGYCTKCDEEIAPKRLAIDPAAAFCIKCAGRA